MQRPQSIQNEQLQGQKQHFLEAQSLVSPDKPKNKEAHIDWQIYSLLKRELSCVELYPFSIQPIKGNNCGLIPYPSLGSETSLHGLRANSLEFSPLDQLRVFIAKEENETASSKY